MVDRKTLTPQQDVQAPIAEATALGRDGFHALAQDGIVGALRLLPDRHAAEAGGFTRPPFAHPVMPHEIGDSSALSSGRHHFFPSMSFSATLSSMASASMRLSLAFSSSSNLGAAVMHEKY